MAPPLPLGLGVALIAHLHHHLLTIEVMLHQPEGVLATIAQSVLVPDQLLSLVFVGDPVGQVSVHFISELLVGVGDGLHGWQYYNSMNKISVFSC